MMRAKSRHPFRRRLLFLAALLLPLSAAAQIGPWRTLTNMKDVQMLTAAAGRIWAGTTGGLFSFDPDSGGYQTFTNLDGLSDNEVVTLTADAQGRIWMGFASGLINVLDPQTGAVKTIVDYERFFIHHLLVYGDTVYVGLDIGLGEYRISREEPKELYRQLGVSIPREVPVQRVLVYDGTLYVGTTAGVAHAGLDIPNLKAPQSWVDEDINDGLPDNLVHDLAVFQGKIVAATKAGIAVREADRWRDVSANLAGRDITALAARDTGEAPELFAAYGNLVYRSSDLSGWAALPALPDKVADLVVADGVLWAGVHGSGLARFDAAAGEWRYFVPAGPKTNLFGRIAFDQQRGILWCTSPRDGVFAYDGTQWYDFSQFNLLKSGDFRAVVVDENETVWVGSWGRGLFRIEGDPAAPTVTRFDTSGGVLSGSTPVNPGFVVVNDLALDGAGNLWLSNFDALNGRAIAARTPAGEWHYFSIAEGLRFKNLSRIYPDSRGRLWYGSEGSGIELLDYGGTVDDPSDDNLAVGLVQTSQLFSPQITAIAEDRDGTIWIGTPLGMHFIFNDRINDFFGTGAGNLISTNIQALAVDPANNKWIGTNAGISVLLADNFNFMHFTKETSPLVDDHVVDFAFDRETGDVYIATTNGLSVVRTPFSAPKQDFSLLKGYPNPLILDAQGASFTIKNLVAQSGVSIFDESGKLIRSYLPGTILGSQVVWDGRDDRGNLVPSGIYVYVAYTQEGRRAAGKVAVVRR